MVNSSLELNACRLALAKLQNERWNDFIWLHKMSNDGIFKFCCDFALFAYSEIFQHMFPRSQEVKADTWINLVEISFSQSNFS
jgi:hypothetical protein